MKNFFKAVRMAWLLAFRYKFNSVGSGFYCGRKLFVRPGTVSVGNDVFIGKYCHLAVSDLKIGNHVMLAPSVAIVGGDHDFTRVGIPIVKAGRGDEKKVVIGDDVWIGYGAIILHGVTIGEGSIIAAGSVVTKSIPPYTIWGGNPAKYLRNRFSSEQENEEHSKELSIKYRRK